MIGHECHIYSNSPQGPRGWGGTDQSTREAYTNYVILCPTHHRQVDAQPGEWPPERLLKIKQDHEQWVRDQSRQEPQAIRVVVPKGAEKVDLQACLTGNQVWNLCIASVHAWNIELPDLESAEAAEAFGYLVDSIQDYNSVHAEMSVTDQLHAHLNLSKSLEEVAERGYWLYAAIRQLRLVGGMGPPTVWRESVIRFFPLSVHEDP